MASQELVTQKQALATVDNLFRANAKKLRQIACKNVDLNRLYRIMMSAFAKTPKLWECSTESVLNAMMQAAEVGLEPNTPLGHAYLVPYKGECQYQIGYKGLSELFRRSGYGLYIDADCVYDGDEYRVVRGNNPTIEHTPKLGSRQPKDIIYAYAVARYRNGMTQFDVMTRDEIELIRKRSPAKDSGPWTTDYAEMAKKTVIKRLAKRLPQSTEMRAAVRMENSYDLSAIEAEFGDLPDMEELPSAQNGEPQQALLPEGDPAPQSKNAQLQ